MTREAKRCPYCMAPHERRARACSPEHEAKIRGKMAAVTTGRRRAIRRQLEKAWRLGRHRRTWREAAMGKQLDLALIFGAEPHPGLPRHGDNLDA